MEGAQPPYGFKALGGVAVIADNTWAASRPQETEGRMGIRPACHLHLGGIKKTLLEPSTNRNRLSAAVGDVEAAFGSAAKIVEANYYTPLLAHAPMEPPAALADYREGKVEVWAATQDPQASPDNRLESARYRRKPMLHVTSHFLAAAFGRKSKPDYVAEAAIFRRKLANRSRSPGPAKKTSTSITSTPTSAMYFKAGLDAQASRPPGCSAPYFPYRLNLR